MGSSKLVYSRHTQVPKQAQPSTPVTSRLGKSGREEEMYAQTAKYARQRWPLSRALLSDNHRHRRDTPPQPAAALLLPAQDTHTLHDPNTTPYKQASKQILNKSALTPDAPRARAVTLWPRTPLASLAVRGQDARVLRGAWQELKQERGLVLTHKWRRGVYFFSCVYKGPTLHLFRN